MLMSIIYFIYLYLNKNYITKARLRRVIFHRYTAHIADEKCAFGRRLMLV